MTRLSKITLSLAGLLTCVGAASALALPSGGGLGSRFGAPALQKVQLQCNASRCIDPRTGAYTQSTCSRGGCRPLGGIVGYARPPRPGYAPRYERPRGGYGYYYEDRPRYRDDYYAPRYRRDPWGGNDFDEGD